MKKAIALVTLCVIIMVGFLIMFDLHILGQDFHEYGGLVLLVVMLVHAAIHYKWIAGVTKRLFTKGTKLKARICYALNVLLLICVILIGVSGLAIAKSFPFQLSLGGGNWKAVHIGASFLLLVLGGIHVGLHSDWFIDVAKKLCRKTEFSRVTRIIAVSVLATLMCGGAYYAVTTNLVGNLRFVFRDFKG